MFPVFIFLGKEGKLDRKKSLTACISWLIILSVFLVILFLPDAIIHKMMILPTYLLTIVCISFGVLSVIIGKIIANQIIK
jgi:hypothetical protein